MDKKTCAVSSECPLQHDEQGDFLPCGDCGVRVPMYHDIDWSDAAESAVETIHTVEDAGDYDYCGNEAWCGPCVKAFVASQSAIANLFDAWRASRHLEITG